MRSRTIPFAFISYSRRDSAAADFIQNMLEHFRYPKDSIAEERHPKNATFVRDIFVDRTTLPADSGEFKDGLREYLEASRYLIVICSPNSAREKAGNEHFVNWEIETFLALHKNDTSRVIPVILAGEPDLSAESCLPLPIRTAEFTSRNLPDMRVLPGQAKGWFRRRRQWSSAVVTLLSYVFQVERSIIYDRFAAERARLRQKIWGSIALVLVIIAALTAWFLVERSRAWAETERNRALAETERSRKLDMEAWKYYSDAMNLLEKEDVPGQVPQTDLALARLSKADHLPLARNFLLNLLLQRSWLIPVEITDKPGTFPPLPVLSADPFEWTVPMDVPADFPLKYEYRNSTLTARDAKTGESRWSVPQLPGVMRLGVAPNGLALIAETAAPAPALAAFDPFSGRRLWSSPSGGIPRVRCFSRDGRRFAFLTPTPTPRLQVIDAATGEREFEPVTPGGDIISLEFSDDDGSLLAGTPKNTLRYALVRHLPELPLGIDGLPVTTHAGSPWGRYFALALNNGSSGLLDIFDGRTLARISRREMNGESIPALAFSPDERFLAAVTMKDDKTSFLNVFELSTEEIKPLSRISLPFAARTVAFLPDSSGCLLCGVGLPGEPKAPWLLRFSARGRVAETKMADDAPLERFLLAGDRVITLGSKVRIWKLADETLLGEFKPQGQFETLLAAPDGKTLAISSRLNRRVEILTPEGRRLWGIPPYVKPGVAPMATDPSGKFLAVAVGGDSVRVFEWKTGVFVSRVLDFPGILVRNLKFIARRDQLYLCISGAEDKAVLPRGFYAFYDVRGQAVVRSNFVRSGDIDAIYELSGPELLLTGINNSQPRVIQLPVVAGDDDFADFWAFTRLLSGMEMNLYDIPVPASAPEPVSRLSGIWQRFLDEAATAPGNRNFSVFSNVSLRQVAEFASDGNLASKEEALSVMPTNLTVMGNYWIRKCRTIARENYEARNPGKTARDNDMYFAAFTVADWVKFMFDDPQASYFADHFTRRMVELSPKSEDAQKARSTFLRLTGQETAAPSGEANPRRNWDALVKSESVSIGDLNAAAWAMAAETCRDPAAYRRFLEELRGAFARLDSRERLTSEITTGGIELANDIGRYTLLMPDGAEQYAAFLRGMIDVARNFRPESSAQGMICQWYLQMAEGDLVSGRAAEAAAALAEAKKLQAADMTAPMQIELLEILLPVSEPNSEAALVRYREFRNKYLAYGDSLLAETDKALRADLEIMRRNNVAPDGGKRLLAALSADNGGGVPVKLVKGGRAEKSGWKDSDRVVSIDGYPVGDSKTLQAVLNMRNRPESGPYEVVLNRDGKPVRITQEPGRLGIYY